MKAVLKNSIYHPPPKKKADGLEAGSWAETWFTLLIEACGTEHYQDW